jgi:glycosyltransferase involved in cell wall biosynthesis
MKIGMILERDFPTTPPDIRVEKEAQSLIRGGHQVELLSLKITSTADQERIEGVNVFRVPINILCIKDWNESLVETHFHSEDSPWVDAVTNFITNRKIDVLHVHDLPLVWTASKAASFNGIPVVFDMHEIYPPMVQFMKRKTQNGWDPTKWVSEYEAECLKLVDKTIVVVEESRQRLLNMGIPNDKIAVIMNTEDIKKMECSRHNRKWRQNLKDRFLVTYVGTFGEIRGLDMLLYATKELENEIPIHLLLVGGAYNQPELERIAREQTMEDRVTITGWVDFKEIPDFIAMSDVCVVPHVKNEFTDATIPHKLFQYMLMGKPVIVSNAAPLKRIVEECNCGRVFSTGDIGDLSSTLFELAVSGEKRKRLGQNGLKAALAIYNWGNEEAVLLDTYNTIHNEKQNPLPMKKA